MPFLEFVVTFTAKNSVRKHHNDTFVDYQKGLIHHVGHYNQGNRVNGLQRYLILLGENCH